MRMEYWAERCREQNVQFLEGAVPGRVGIFGFVLGRDERSIYPVGIFEKCGEVAVYPAQTLNPTEEELIMGAAFGLARSWDKCGILTLRFAKQLEGGDFALLDAYDDITPEARNLLTMRALWDGEGASFLKPGAKAPELLELRSVGVSLGEELHTAGSLREALLKLPKDVLETFTGWYEKVLRHEG